MRVEKSAYQQVGFLGATMMRAPGKALQVRVGGHARPFRGGRPLAKGHPRGVGYFLAAVMGIAIGLAYLQVTFGLYCANTPLGLSRITQT
jgi:hypothetical protein